MDGITQAQASDASALTPLVYSSGPAAFDFVFLSDAEAFLAQTLAQDTGSFGYQSHYVARREHQLLGALSLFTRQQHNQFHNANVGAILRWAGWRSPLVLLRGLKLEKLIPAPPEASLHIAHLGVAMALRGQGLGTQLLKFAEQRAVHLGLKQLSLDVAADNHRAEALYHAFGFQERSYRHSQIPGLADHKTLVKTL